MDTARNEQYQNYQQSLADDGETFFCAYYDEAFPDDLGTIITHLGAFEVSEQAVLALRKTPSELVTKLNLDLSISGDEWLQALSAGINGIHLIPLPKTDEQSFQEWLNEWADAIGAVRTAIETATKGREDLAKVDSRPSTLKSYDDKINWLNAGITSLKDLSNQALASITKLAA